MGQGNSSSNAFLKSMDMGKPIDEAQVEAIWLKYDDDNSGSLEEEEIQNFLGDYIKINNIEKDLDFVYKEFMKEYDADGDGDISWEELTRNKDNKKVLKVQRRKACYQAQEKAVKRWVNYNLKKKGLSITDISKDFSDGVNLCYLMEIISDRKIRKWNKKPKISFQRVENIELALLFMKSEGLKLVNTGASDIHQGKLSIIMGLIWTLILRYHIQKLYHEESKNSRDDDDIDSKRGSVKEINSLDEIDIGSLHCHKRHSSKSHRKKNSLSRSFSRESNSIKRINSLDDIGPVVGHKRRHSSFDGSFDQAALDPTWDELADFSESSKWLIDLVKWVNSRLEIVDISVKGFKAEWRKPKILSALVHSLIVDSGGISDLMDFTGSPVERMEKAMVMAEEKLDVPRLIDADALVEWPETLSLLTYISFFRNKYNNLRRKCKIDISGCYIDGLDLGAQVHNSLNRSNFKINAVDIEGNPIGKMDNVGCEVILRDPNGIILDVDVEQLSDSEEGSFLAQYKPTCPGKYALEVSINGETLANDGIYIEEGISPDAFKDCDITFTIHAKNRDGGLETEGGDLLKVDVKDNKNQSIDVKCTDNGDGTYTADYTLINDQVYVVNASLNGEPLAQSPWVHDLQREKEDL